MKKIILIISIFFIGINFTYAKETVKFSDCVDGDTIKVLIDEKEYKTLYDRLNATIDTINNYTTYKLEGATYVKINNTLDQFKVAPTEEETIKAAKNKSVTSATGRNYINLLREAINKLI